MDETLLPLYINKIYPIGYNQIKYIPNYTLSGIILDVWKLQSHVIESHVAIQTPPQLYLNPQN